MNKILLKIKGLLLSLIFLLQYFISFGQIISPLEFTEDVAKWTRNSISTLLPDRQPVGLRGEFDPIIKDGYLYTVYNMFESPIWPGFLVEKIDLSTGEMVWKHEQYGTHINRRYGATAPRLAENGDLSITWIDEFDSDPNTWVLIWSGPLGQMKFDGKTGVVIDSTITNPRDTNVVRLVPPFYAPFNSARTFIFYEDQKYYLTDIRYPNLQEERIFRRLNSAGVVEENTVIRKPLELSHHFVHHRRTQDNNIYSLLDCRSRNENPVRKSLFLIEADPKGNILKETQFPAEFYEGYETALIRSINNNGIVIQNSEVFENRKNYKISRLTLDKEIVEELVIDAKDLSYSIFGVSTDEGNMIIATSPDDGVKSSLKFYKTDGSGQMVFEKELFAKNSDQFFTLENMFLTEGNDVLVELSVKYFSYIDIPNPPGEKNWILLPGSLFGLQTSVSDLVDTGSIKIYPNPSQDRVFLESSLEYDEVIMTDLYGQRIKRWGNTSDLDISDLEAGVYFVKVLKSGRLVVPSKKLIKVR